MKRLYEESESQQQQSETSSQARARLQSQEDAEDAELDVQPFGSRTQSDQPVNGRGSAC